MPSRPPEPKPSRLTIVLADWCPHCVPLSEVKVRELANRLDIPVRRLDIDDPAEEREADALVQTHGDWSPDYLIPQVFLEWTDGHVDHLLTGFPEGVSRTRRAWDDLFQSDLVRRLASAPGT
jgi:thiol-disulfide isomerase/thioredoxin